MRIIQLSDLHIASEGEQPFYVDVRNNLLLTLNGLQKVKADMVIVTGDVSFRSGDKQIYRWVLDQLKILGLPVYCIAGNHDDPVLLGEVFHPDKPVSSDGKLYYFVRKPGFLFLFIDTADGYLGKQQLDWMYEISGRYFADRLHIFMHHPPIYAGVPHMDGKHAFREMDAFLEFTRKVKKLIQVFTGHYHVQKMVQKEGLNVHIAPSTFFHIQGDIEAFAIDHTNPGYQIIDLEDDKVTVHAHYLY